MVAGLGSFAAHHRSSVRQLFGSSSAVECTAAMSSVPQQYHCHCVGSTVAASKRQ